VVDRDGFLSCQSLELSPELLAVTLVEESTGVDSLLLPEAVQVSSDLCIHSVENGFYRGVSSSNETAVNAAFFADQCLTADSREIDCGAFKGFVEQRNVVFNSFVCKLGLFWHSWAFKTLVSLAF
jgi:hypothetical protein